MIGLQCLAISVGLAFILSIPLIFTERRRKTSNDLLPVSGEITINTERSI